MASSLAWPYDLWLAKDDLCSRFQLLVGQGRPSLSLDSNAVDSIDGCVTGLAFQLLVGQGGPSLSLASNAVDSIDGFVTGLAFQLLVGQGRPLLSFSTFGWPRTTFALAGFECGGFD
jgi:hypothetical protein